MYPARDNEIVKETKLSDNNSGTNGKNIRGINMHISFSHELMLQCLAFDCLFRLESAVRLTPLSGHVDVFFKKVLKTSTLLFILPLKHPHLP